MHFAFQNNSVFSQVASNNNSALPNALFARAVVIIHGGFRNNFSSRSLVTQELVHNKSSPAPAALVVKNENSSKIYNFFELFEHFLPPFSSSRR